MHSPGVNTKQRLCGTKPCIVGFTYPQDVKSGSQPVISGPSKLTQQELKVLKDTMVINGNNYYPWSDEDIDDLFRDKVLFEDPDGKLALSAEQEKNFGSWKRASEIMEDPRMVCLVSSASIVQEVVTDCSFVASLCVSASYERRGKKQVNLILLR